MSRMSSRELSEWMAYAQIEPFGEERADLRSAIVASTIANIYRDKRKQAQPFEPGDFMPKFNAPTDKPGKDPSALYALIRTWARLQK